MRSCRQVHDTFNKKFMHANIIPTVTNVVLISYRGMPKFWTQEKIEKWIAKRIKEVEQKYNGSIVNVYGSCMGGYFATETYRQLQRNFNQERKKELEKQGYNKLIVDRSFTNLNSIFAHFCSILENSSSFVTKTLNCDLVNPFFSADPKLQQEIKKNINMKNVTFIESDKKDDTTPPFLQLGVMARQRKLGARHFFIDNDHNVHVTAFGNKGTKIAQIDESGERNGYVMEIDKNGIKKEFFANNDNSVQVQNRLSM